MLTQLLKEIKTIFDTPVDFGDRYANDYVKLPYTTGCQNTWTVTTYEKPRVQFYWASRPGKRWKK